MSPVERTTACLARISQMDGELNAFVTVMADDALAQARAAEGALMRGSLHGMSVAVKDVIDVRGVPTTAGSRIRANAVPAAADAAVVERLRSAGAIFIGKTATHEFAYGSTTDSPFHGPTRNPADLARSPGGSSGGSAAAVAADMVPVALGTDTAGSVRVPAACCGVVGFKPTYGRVSSAGIVPLSWSLDHPGVLARRVADAALVLGVISDAPWAPPPAVEHLRGIRIGVPHGWLTGPIEPAVQVAFDRALSQLRALGAEVVPVELPPLELLHFVSRILILAEAGAYHAPNLGRSSEYGADVRVRVELGQYILARDYLLAQRLRSELCRAMADVMGQVHMLATPTMPIPAPLIGERTWIYPNECREAVGEAMQRFAGPFNVTGQPAISLPCGVTADGLPLSVQLVGPVDGEEELALVAGALEGAL